MILLFFATGAGVDTGGGTGIFVGATGGGGGGCKTGALVGADLSGGGGNLALPADVGVFLSERL